MATGDDSGIRQDVRAGRDAIAVGRDLTINVVSLVKPSGMVVVGDIPQQAVAFRPRAGLGPGSAGRSSETPAVRVLIGGRGVGKTQMAAGRARQCIDEKWSLVGWVDGSSPARMIADLHTIGDSLGLSRPDDKAAHAAGRVRNWLESDGRGCLLVFDNVMDAASLRRFLPASGASEIVITSTQRSTGILGEPIPVAPFDEAEAVAYLRDRAGLADDGNTRRLAGDLGYLPLALAQAAAVMSREGLDCDTYLKRMRAFPLASYLPPVPGDPYPDGLVQAVLFSVASVKAHDDTGLCGVLMDLLAILSPAGIPRRLLQDGADHGVFSILGKSTIRVPVPFILNGRQTVGYRDGRPDAFVNIDRSLRSDPSAMASLDRALGLLEDASLITRSRDSRMVSAHRLTMEIVRRGFPSGIPKRSGTISCAFVLLFEIVRDIDNVWQDALLARQVIDQIDALHEHMMQFATTMAAKSISRNGYVRRSFELKAKSIPIRLELRDETELVLGSAVGLAAESEKALGRRARGACLARFGVAEAYRASGKLPEAIRMYQLAIRQSQYSGIANSEVRVFRAKLALSYREAGRPRDAINEYRAIGVDGNLSIGFMSLHFAAPTFHGESRTARIDYFFDLMRAYESAGRGEEIGELCRNAAPEISRLVEQRRRTFGDHHHLTLDSIQYLALAHHGAGAFDKAIPLYKRVLENAGQIREYPRMKTHYFLGHAYLRAGRAKDAVVQFEVLIADAERLFGQNHFNVLDYRSELAQAYKRAGRKRDAVGQLETVLAYCGKFLGQDHPVTRNFIRLSKEIRSSRPSRVVLIPPYLEAEESPEATVKASSRNEDKRGFIVNLATFLGVVEGMVFTGSAGWLLGGHGIHLLGDHLRPVTVAAVPLTFSAAMAVSLKAARLASSAQTDKYASVGRPEPASLKTLIKAGTIFAAIIAVVSGILHLVAPGAAGSLLGVEHGANIIRDWLSWKF